MSAETAFSTTEAEDSNPARGAYETVNLRRSYRSLWPLWLVFVASFPVGVRLRDQFPDFVWELPDFLGDGLGTMPLTKFILLPVFVLLYMVWIRLDSKYTLGERGAIITTGILGVKRRRVMAEYSKIQGVSTEDSVVGQLFGFGDINMGTAETSDTEFKFKGLAKPEAVVALIVDRITAVRRVSAL